MAYSSKNVTFIQKWHIHPKWQIHPKITHLSKNDTFIKTWQISPKNYDRSQGNQIMKLVFHIIFNAEEIFKTSQCEEKKGTGPEEKLLPWLMLLQLLVGIALKGENL